MCTSRRVTHVSQDIWITSFVTVSNGPSFLRNVSILSAVELRHVLGPQLLIFWNTKYFWMCRIFLPAGHAWWLDSSGHTWPPDTCLTARGVEFVTVWTPGCYKSKCHKSNLKSDSFLRRLDITRILTYHEYTGTRSSSRVGAMWLCFIRETWNNLLVSTSTRKC